MRVCAIACVAAGVALAACDVAPRTAQDKRPSATDNSLGPFEADGPPADASPFLADIRLVADQMMGTTVVTDDPFEADDCAIAEGCIGGPGTRRLVRFDTVTANYGEADLYFGPPPAAGVSNDVFTWSVCHQHHHVTNYALYELLDDSGTVLVTGRKQAFCLMDVEQVNPLAAGTGYNCDNQGISRGWADVYGRFLACQWLDVTDVPSGQYHLRVTVNPLHIFPESDYTNNTFETLVNF